MKGDSMSDHADEVQWTQESLEMFVASNVLASRVREKHNEISNPAHYHEGRKFSPDEVIEDWDLGFRLGNVVKYISRAGRKGPALTDLQKAADYLAKEIASLERAGVERAKSVFLNPNAAAESKAIFGPTITRKEV